jgi:hypothetical protein
VGCNMTCQLAKTKNGCICLQHGMCVFATSILCGLQHGVSVCKKQWFVPASCCDCNMEECVIATCVTVVCNKKKGVCLQLLQLVCGLHPGQIRDCNF